MGDVPQSTGGRWCGLGPAATGLALAGARCIGLKLRA